MQTEKEKLIASLSDIEHDINILERQKQSEPPHVMPTVEMTMILARRSNNIDEQLHELKIRRFELLDQIKELEELE